VYVDEKSGKNEAEKGLNMPLSYYSMIALAEKGSITPIT